MRPGEALCLKAPSGAGKTTFLKLVAGLVKPTGGSCERFFDRPAFAFQDQRLLPWLDAAGNIEFAAGCPHKAAVEWLDRLGIGDCSSCLPGELSGGQCQRVNLARMLAARPDMLFLDEPFNGLDEANGLRVTELLLEWRRENPSSGMLMVSHLAKSAEGCGAQLCGWREGTGPYRI